MLLVNNADTIFMVDNSRSSSC